MAFAYYDRLSRSQQIVYRMSERVGAIRVHDGAPLVRQAEALREALASEDLERTSAQVARLLDGLTERLGVPPVQVEVLAERPRFAGAELHGLYTRPEDESPVIRVWMRTARKGRVVAFSTFLRTVLHELCHHLDLELLGLPISFHTEGFFKRESSLFHQLVPSAPRRGRPQLSPPPAG